MNEEKLKGLEKKLNRILILNIVFGLIILGTILAIQNRKIVKAESFIVIDQAGNKRAMLGSIQERVSLKIYDKHQNPRAALEVGEERQVRLTLMDSEGRDRAELGVDDEKGVVLSIYDKNGKAGATLETQGPSDTRLSFKDENGVHRAGFGMQSGGNVGLYLGDSHGHDRARLKVSENDMPWLEIVGKGGMRRMIMGLEEENPMISFTDDKEQPSISIIVDRENTPAFMFHRGTDKAWAILHVLDLKDEKVPPFARIGLYNQNGMETFSAP